MIETILIILIIEIIAIAFLLIFWEVIDLILVCRRYNPQDDDVDDEKIIEDLQKRINALEEEVKNKKAIIVKLCRECYNDLERYNPYVKNAKFEIVKKEDCENYDPEFGCTLGQKEPPKKWQKWRK